MGISKAAVHYMLKESRQEPFGGRVLTLGVQQTMITEKELIRLAARLGHPLNRVDDAAVEKLDRRQHLTDVYLLLSLGFEEVVRMDFSDFQGADFTFDLNASETPADQVGRFDVLIDGGTIEHVFHLPNSFKHIFEFLKIGGRVIHMSPSSNHIDHGFYMFSPTLFWDFYSANRFEFSSFKFIETNRWGNTQRWIAGDYTPGSLRYVSAGGLPRGQYALALTARKTAASTGTAIPQMHRYATTWSRKKPRKVSRSVLAYRIRKRIEQIWKKNRVRSFPLPVSERY